MITVRNGSWDKFFRVDQEDLKEAFTDLILKKGILDKEELEKWEIRFPLMNYDILRMEYKIGEEE